MQVQRTFVDGIVQDPFTVLDLRRLRLLRELEARGTVGAVAEALAYSPSAVSQQLAVLQREAGVALLEPAGRGLRLTDAGRTLAAHADALLRRMEAAEADLAAVGGQVAGVVRVAAFQTAALRFVAPALRDLGAAHPGLRAELVEAELEQAVPALRLGALDVVIGEEYAGVPRPRPEGLARELLFSEPVRLLLPAAHPLAAPGPAAPVRVADLGAVPWTTGAPGTGQRELVVRTCRAHGGFEPDLRHASNDLLILTAVVRELGAATLLPDLVGAAEDPAIAVRDLRETALERDVFLLTRAGSERRPAVSAVLAALRARLPG